MSEPYDVGALVKVYATFRDDAGVVGDPNTSVTLTVRKPDGTSSDVTVFAGHVIASGYYEAFIPADQHGTWEGHWRGVGTNITAARRVEWKVRRARVLDPVGE